jgi:hypothetical protein
MDKAKDVIAAQAKREAASLLGVDADNLSPADTLRCDLISTLRLVIDDAGATVLNGSSTDLGRLITATESLIALLPNRELPKPAPRADDPNDPRKIMFETYMAMRRRGELAEPTSTYEGMKAEVERLRGELAAFKSENEQLRVQLAGSVPLPPNVVPMRHATSEPSARAAAAPQPPKPAPAAPATGGLLTDNVDEPWRPFVSGGAHYDRWGNHN